MTDHNGRSIRVPMNSPRNFVALLAIMFTVWPVLSLSQTYLYDRIQVTNELSTSTVEVSKPASVTSNQSIVFPSTLPSPGNILVISSVSGSTINLGWGTPSIGTKPPSDRVRTAQDAAAPTGLRTAVSASKTYQVRGLLIVNRKNVVGGSDNLAITLTGPSGSTDADLVVRCYNCPSGTTGVPSFSTGTSSCTTTTIDPTGTDFSELVLSIEGRLVVGGTSGTLTITATNASVGTNNVVLGAQSCIVITEVL